MRTFIPSGFGKETVLFVGKVEDRSDPLQLGRVRVRIHGLHTEDTSLIPTESLPWAQILMPGNNAAVSGVGESPTGLMLGSLVMGFFADGNEQQIPIVMGSINTLESLSNSGLLPQDKNVINDSLNGIPGTDNPTGDGPQWLQMARGELGTKEAAGAANNPRINEYLATVGLSNDSTPWCSAFVAWSLKKSGINIQGATGMAKSWLNHPSMEKLDSPIYGCIVVYNRPPNPNSGHVGFYVGAEGGRVKTLGGNQSDSVTIAGYSAATVAGFRWPKGQPKDFQNNSAVSNSLTTSSTKQT